ncbi:glycosyltransferase 10 family protein [Synechococcus sp. PROS-7-1]|uniref:glycosyltransferase family 10 domain-containing protein n=1 Tax=Synechococcus sp. PROS-7-1 TaxID=1442556 RepID=UPI0016465C38|nr:glycosyltransferase family 10 [Synechococcus sp. PROS-7-1]QNI83938.1 glycosyltransferase 10 family protein [Synechococcus sp. PROS-7-1]
MQILLLDEMWGPISILRQTINCSGLSSRAKFSSNCDQDFGYDYILVQDEKNMSAARKYPQVKRIHICMENPDIWSPSLKFLSNIDFIFTPFPQVLANLPTKCRVIQSYPCVPWFYDIDFSTNAGLTHVPLHSTSELSQLITFPMPKKDKLLSIILSSKNGGLGYGWRLQFANALKSYFGDLIDIYGFGHNPLANKKDAIDPYLATIVLENSSHPFYITEKIADAVLGWSMPIYCGSESISNLLPGYKWTLQFGSDIDACCRQVKQYLHQILGDSTVLPSIRTILLNRLNLFEEIPFQLSKI